MVLRGCYVAIVTPFDKTGAVDEKGLRSNIDFLIGKGVAGVVPCGTTGESATLSWDEHNRVVDIALEQARGKIQVIAGAGSNSTVESLAAARHAQSMRADAILSITPYYNKPTQEGLYQHYRAIATQVEIPMVVYNVPSRTGVNILPETIERLCEFKNIVAVILSGDDPLTLPILACGGAGVISVTANFAPDNIIAMIKAFAAKDTAKALALHEKLLPLSQAMFIETNPIPVKETMNLLGMSAGPLRLPLVAMNERNKQQLIAVLRTCGFSL